MTPAVGNKYSQVRRADFNIKLGTQGGLMEKGAFHKSAKGSKGVRGADSRGRESMVGGTSNAEALV